MPDRIEHRLEDFHLGAQVFTSDGKHVGILDRVIVDNKLHQLHEFIVKETKLFSGHLLSPGSALMTDDLIVPVSALDSLSHDRIVLNLNTSEVRRLHPYLSYSRAPLEHGSALMMAANLLAAQASVQPLVEHADKAANELEIDVGESVMLGKTGKRLGHVKDVLIDDGDVVGVVLHPGGLFKHEVILPRRFLGRSDDLDLFAHLTEEDLENLTPVEPGP